MVLWHSYMGPFFGPGPCGLKAPKTEKNSCKSGNGSEPCGVRHESAARKIRMPPHKADSSREIMSTRRANLHVSQAVKPLLHRIPRAHSRRGPRRHNPENIHADRACDISANHRLLRKRGITDMITHVVGEILQATRRPTIAWLGSYCHPASASNATAPYSPRSSSRRHHHLL